MSRKKDLEKYFLDTATYESFEEDFVVVFDTNVLLNFYRWERITVDELEKTLKKLDQNNKLYFSLQVIKEFSANRPTVIAESINKIDTEMSNIQKPKETNTLSPVLEGYSEIERINKVRCNYLKIQSTYKEALKELRQEVQNLYYDDSFLKLLNDLSENSIIKYYDNEYIKKVKQEAAERFKNKIPPGFKDADKDKNSEGDYFIWKDLMALDNNVIFVTSDIKKDWVYKDRNGKILTPLPELQQEFFEKNSQYNLLIIKPDEFIEKYNPGVEENVIKDIKSSTMSANLASNISEQTAQALKTGRMYGDLTSNISEQIAQAMKAGTMYGDLVSNINSQLDNNSKSE